MDKLTELPLIRNRDATESAVIECSRSLVAEIIPERVLALDFKHELAEGPLAGFNHQMEMIVHDYIIEECWIVLFKRFHESLEEHRFVVFRFVDEGAVVPPLEDMVDGIRAYDA